MSPRLACWASAVGCHGPVEALAQLSRSRGAALRHGHLSRLLYRRTVGSTSPRVLLLLAFRLTGRRTLHRSARRSRSICFSTRPRHYCPPTFAGSPASNRYHRREHGPSRNPLIVPRIHDAHARDALALLGCSTAICASSRSPPVYSRRQFRSCLAGDRRGDSAQSRSRQLTPIGARLRARSVPPARVPSFRLLVVTYSTPAAVFRRHRYRTERRPSRSHVTRGPPAPITPHLCDTGSAATKKVPGVRASRRRKCPGPSRSSAFALAPFPSPHTAGPALHYQLVSPARVDAQNEYCRAGSDPTLQPGAE